MAGFFPSCWQVYSFLDKMSFYNELYKHKPHDVVSHEDGTLWRRQTPKLLYPLGKIKRSIKRRKAIVTPYSPWGCSLFIKRFPYPPAFIPSALKRQRQRGKYDVAISRFQETVITEHSCYCLDGLSIKEESSAKELIKFREFYTQGKH